MLRCIAIKPFWLSSFDSRCLFVPPQQRELFHVSWNSNECLSISNGKPRMLLRNDSKESQSSFILVCKQYGHPWSDNCVSVSLSCVTVFERQYFVLFSSYSNGLNLAIRNHYLWLFHKSTSLPRESNAIYVVSKMSQNSLQNVVQMDRNDLLTFFKLGAINLYSERKSQ